MQHPDQKESINASQREPRVNVITTGNAIVVQVLSGSALGGCSSYCITSFPVFLRKEGTIKLRFKKSDNER
jgi:hypothetical protein